jgi:hypothetical protein
MDDNEFDVIDQDEHPQVEEDDDVGLLPGIDDLPEFANPEARKIHAENLENEKLIEVLANPDKTTMILRPRSKALQM